MREASPPYPSDYLQCVLWEKFTCELNACFAKKAQNERVMKRLSVGILNLTTFEFIAGHVVLSRKSYSIQGCFIITSVEVQIQLHIF